MSERVIYFLTTVDYPVGNFVMEERRIYCCQGADQPLPVTDGNDRYTAAVAAPILCEGDVLGLVLFLSAEGQIPGEGEYKLAQTVSAFLGKHMEA